MTTVTGNLTDVRARVSGGLAAQLPGHLARLVWDNERLAAHQRDRLRALIVHARERSPFHARRLAGIDVDGLEDLAQLPVMTKRDLMERFDEVVTDRRLTRDLVEEHLAASTAEPRLLLDEYVCLASGGSSGLRGVFVQSVDEYAQFGLGILRRPMARLLAAGGPPPGGLLIAMVAAASPIHSTAFGSSTATDGPARLVSVPATLPLAEIVDRLNELQPPAIQGYTTKLAQLAREQRAGRLRIAPWSITTTSEPLTHEDREGIQSAFGVPVVDQFAATEGAVGHTEPGERTITFATDLAIVEPVDAANRPVPPGTPSDKVLVTNLHNLTLPLIRLEVTDRFVACNPALGEGYLRATVDGRSDDVLRYGDVEVHPIAIRGVMVRAQAISEYQVRQTPQGLDVSVVADAALDERAVAAALEASLRDTGLRAPEVSVQRVAAIARHAETGKARRFVPAEP
jgi:phenylacetate-CoA ligase